MKKESIETNPRLTQTIKLAEKHIKTAIMTTFHMLKKDGKRNASNGISGDETTKCKMKNTLVKIKGRRKD